MKLEKIGILTLPPGKNFGGILQAYALCESINNLGCSAVFGRGQPLSCDRESAKRRKNKT